MKRLSYFQYFFSKKNVQREYPDILNEREKFSAAWTVFFDFSHANRVHNNNFSFVVFYNER